MIKEFTFNQDIYKRYLKVCELNQIHHRFLATYVPLMSLSASEYTFVVYYQNTPIFINRAMFIEKID